MARRGIETWVDGLKFDSEPEAAAYTYLRNRQVVDLTMKPRYSLFPKGKRIIVNPYKGWNGNSKNDYTADFSYHRVHDGELIIVELKPEYLSPTDPARLRIRAFLELYPNIIYTIMSYKRSKPRNQPAVYSFQFHWYMPLGKVFDDRDIS